MLSTGFDKREGKIWMDGQLVNWQDSKVHILNHGLHYATSVFEGIRVYNGVPFKLKEHIDRLMHSAVTLGFVLKYSVEDLINATHAVIETNRISNGYIRPIAWLGSESMIIDGAGCAVHFAVAGWQSFEDARSAMREVGARLIVSKWRKPSMDAALHSTKASAIYSMSYMVKNEAKKLGYDDGLMLDGESNITEASTSNFFAIYGEVLRTPVPGCFLNGITRQTIIDIAKQKGIDVEEVDFKVEDLRTADAAFLTGTAIEVMPVQCVSGMRFDINHSMIKLLSEEYRIRASSR